MPERNFNLNKRSNDRDNKSITMYQENYDNITLRKTLTLMLQWQNPLKYPPHSNRVFLFEIKAFFCGLVTADLVLYGLIYKLHNSAPFNYTCVFSSYVDSDNGFEIQSKTRLKYHQSSRILGPQGASHATPPHVHFLQENHRFSSSLDSLRDPVNPVIVMATPGAIISQTCTSTPNFQPNDILSTNQQYDWVMYMR